MGFISRSSKEPVGEIKFFGSSALPVGYLACDGSAVSRTTYAELFAQIGTAYGSGDGSTTFNVPDYRGRTPIGDGTGPGLSARTLGQQVGAETHTLTASEGAVGSHSHTIGTATNGGSDLLIGWGNWSFGGNNWATQIANPGNGNSYARTTSSNASSAHNNMQPSLVCKFGIKY